MRPTELRPDLPVGLERVILQCLSKKPEERPANLVVLAEQLEAFAPPGVAGWVDNIRGLLAPDSLPPAGEGLPSRPSHLPPAPAVPSFVPPPRSGATDADPRRHPAALSASSKALATRASQASSPSWSWPLGLLC